MRLRLAGSSLAKIARELEVQPTTVTSVCLGQRRSRRIEDLIAEKLSTTAPKLWPDRFLGEVTVSPVPVRSEGGPAPGTDLR